MRIEPRRESTAANRWFSVGVVAAALLIQPVLAGQDVPDSGPLPDSLEPVLSRWKRIPPFEATIRAYPMASHPPKSEADARWHRGGWTLTVRDEPDERDLIARFGGTNFELAYTRVGRDAIDESMSMIDGEFIHLLGVDNGGPSAFIHKRPDAPRFRWDMVLMMFEQAFSELQEPWPVLFERLEFRCTAVEELEGILCWRLENMRDADRYRATVWVSTEHDWAPLRARSVYVLNGEPVAETELRVTGYTPVGQSFVPASALISVTNKHVDGYQMSAYDVVGIKVGREYRPRSLRGRLPAGTAVTDLVRHEYWTVDAQNRQRDLQPIDPEERIALQRALQAQINQPRLKRSRNTAMVLIGLATGVVLAAVVVVRRRYGGA